MRRFFLALALAVAASGLPATSATATTTAAAPGRLSAQATSVPAGVPAPPAAPGLATSAPAAAPPPVAPPTLAPPTVAPPNPEPPPPATPSPSPTPAKKRGIFGRRPGPTPPPSPSPLPTPLPAPAPASPVAATATPTPEPTRPPTPAPKPTSPDRAFTLAGGTWNCQSMAEGVGTHVYEQRDEFTLEMLNRISVGSRTYEIAETYRYDPATERWTTTTGKDAYVGRALPWLGERWVFEGTEIIKGVRHPVRMVYIDLGGAAFRRDFQNETGGRWTTFAAETCKRSVG